MQVPGAGILLAAGATFVEGDFAIEPIARVWPRGMAADALPARAFGTAELRELPQELKDALTEAHVGLGVYPIVSPRGRRGHLFLSSGILGTIVHEDDFHAFEGLVGQLALVLDAAELLTRAVGVERALAHAEKLAAIGELAARVAHEIRNPVTAARSLAQQLVREPVTPDSAESAALILEELERVERRVASLLRFARREDPRLEPVDLGELARATLASFRTRLAAADVDLALDAHSGVIATADREQLRQVLVNLVENALDALADADGPRRLAVAVGSVNGSAVVRVSDSGPGVPADALARLFEPFFSLKATGTGLGLAIVRRTVEAHGGQIRARSSPGAGATFEVTLPLGGRAA
jgi:signal transduction histidine kinase